MSFPRVTTFVHDLVAGRLAEGDLAIDATVGKGLDTRFLAACVGTSGRVEGFEIQESALALARPLLADFPQVRLHHRGHERMAEFVSGPAQAILFNLGYLPSGDKSITTTPETTRQGLMAGLTLLGPEGILSVVVYPGHPGGREEAQAVEDWFASLDGEHYDRIHYGRFPGGPDGVSPYVLALSPRPR